MRRVWAVWDNFGAVSIRAKVKLALQALLEEVWICCGVHSIIQADWSLASETRRARERFNGPASSPLEPSFSASIVCPTPVPWYELERRMGNSLECNRVGGGVTSNNGWASRSRDLTNGAGTRILGPSSGITTLDGLVLYYSRVLSRKKKASPSSVRSSRGKSCY